ncbi:MAG: tetrahydrofolate dehydrogenase/cyclohydrolase catalytic domain-containing protein, partial [Candidatus Saccharimonadales bacterium]|nr:tetrahydrofolate dehydrogenase/cyclohydrolase catalytic domain-containing protein [Candidatus Saccharimonadales bacterium]
MKILNGRELAGFIKERQAKEVRRLKQAENIQPKLAIVQVKDDPVINTYVRLKEKYGQDIGVEVAVYRIEQNSAQKIIATLNEDENVHGIIVQLPLTDPSQTRKIL